MVSNPLDDLFAEQPLRPEQQENECDDVGEPRFDAAADKTTPVKFTDLFAEPDDKTADNRARDRGEAAEDQAPARP
jgi:hypothetical protein